MPHDLKKSSLGESRGTWFTRPAQARAVTTPLLVLGAESDGCITQEEVRATARAYRTEAEIFPNMGHNMMVEPGWEAVAQRIHTWLKTLGPRHSPGNQERKLPTVILRCH